LGGGRGDLQSVPPGGVRLTGGVISGFGVLLLLVAGFATLNRSFAYVALGPLYITELGLGTLSMLWMCRVVARPTITIPALPLVQLVLLLPCVYLLYGVFRIIPDLFGDARLADLLRNFAIVYYALFAAFAYAATVGNSGKRALRTVVVIVVCSTASNSIRLVSVAQGGQLASLAAYTAIIGGHAALFAQFSTIALLGYVQYRAPLRSRTALVPLLGLILGQVIFVYLSGQRTALLSLFAGIATLALLS
jgi:hypothetical protein